MLHRITAIKPLPNYALWAEFTDGSEIVYDVSAVFSKIPEFLDLKNTPGLFEQVSVDGHGYGICWNDNLDLDAEELYANGVLLKSVSIPSPGELCPVCRQKIRRKSESQRMASLANLAKRRSKGGRPVNPNSKRQKALRQSAGQ